jgi:O-methyltransferase involved in polyketide biosynthesis
VEDTLEKVAGLGVIQYVILGAGLDTFEFGNMNDGTLGSV